MSKSVYRTVDGDDKQVPEDVTVTSPKQNLSRRWLFLILIGLSLAALVGLISKQIFTRPATSNTVWNECGGTPDEAHRRGCRFDILSFAWQTPECYDHENTEAFRKPNGTWSYFADPEGTEPRSEEVAMTGEYMTFVVAEYHFTHCTYMWRQLHRAYAILGYIDEHLDNWNHTLHCQKMLLEGPSWNMADVDTVGRIIYSRCRKVW
jgi:hypothetical protein